MVERLATRFRALLSGRGAIPAVEEADDEPAEVSASDPEWDELLAWARESDDEAEWQALITRARQAPLVLRPQAAPEEGAPPRPVAGDEADDDAAEWGRLLDLAKARAGARVSAAATAPPAPAAWQSRWRSPTRSSRGRSTR